MSATSLTITLRTRPKGGAPKPPDAKEIKDLGAARRLLLLIHGYNNDQCDATRAYNGFERLQRILAKLPPNGDYNPGEQVVRVFWPGDADWGIVSFMFFMQAIKNAEQTGKLLAEALERHAGGAPLWVDVVAHSLGCRVTCEMLAALSANSPVRVNRIVFFAAAVATFMLEPNERQGFYDGYNQRVTNGLMSLYSDSDMVLSFAFPAGSTLAPDPQGILPTALGHALWISSHVPLDYRQAENSGAGHSDYWGWKPKSVAKNGRFANLQARDFLRFPTAGSRNLSGINTPVRPGAETREIARRLMLDHTIKERTV